MTRSKQRRKPRVRGRAHCLATSALVAFAAASSTVLADENWPPAPALQAPVACDVGLLPPSVTAEATRDGLWRCTFEFRPPIAPKTATLAGTFNGWNPQAQSLDGPDMEGAWTTEIVLGPGSYQYKFVVNGSRWFHDPRNVDRTSDNHGGYNSVLKLGRLAAMNASNGTVGDEKIAVIGLEHDSQLPLWFQPTAPDRALFRYRTLAHDVAHVSVAIQDGGLADMHVISQDQLFATWEAEAPLPESTRSRRTAGVRQVVYTFVLADPARNVSAPVTYSRSFTEDEVFRTPEWARHAIWYQIFPERFRNGDPSNDPDPVRSWTSEWFTPSPWEGKDGQTFYKWYVFFRQYGGDIAGIEEKLPYLKELGVNALYLNPVFQAPSNHKYDSVNYLHVDEHFGGGNDYDQVAAREDLNDPATWQWTVADRRFLRFLSDAHAAGFRVIIDGVFNHVGRGHPAFQDVLKNGRSSKYADWFDVTSWEPFEYGGWAGHDSLPVFKKSADGLASPAVKQHIFNVTRRWMDPNSDGDPHDGIDGWRLDVPNEIPGPFWVEWRQLVKSINPEAYITGEIWDRADLWLDGKHFDAVMNYQFARAAVAWICHREKKITATEIDRRLAELRLAYPAPATHVMQNLVDSHDTDRLASMALNPDRAYDHKNRVQDDNPNYDNAKPGPDAYQRARLVVLLQMTYVGAPMVYYGDEAGMWGADDPTNRKPMVWEDLQPYEKSAENFVMQDHLAFYKQAIALRNSHPALRTGFFQTLLTDNEKDVWAFARSDDNEHVVVVLNASRAPQEVVVPPPDATPREWTVIFGDADALVKGGKPLEVRVPAVAGVVLHAAHKR